MKQFDDQRFRTYETLKLEDSEKKEVFSKIMTSIDKTKKNREIKNFFTPVLSAALVALFVLFGGYFLATEVIFDEQVNQGASYEERADIEKILNEELGTEVFVPLHSEYPIGTVLVNFQTVFEEDEPIKGDVLGASILYFAGKNQTGFLSEEQLMEYQERTRSEVVFGELYNEESLIEVNIHLGDAPSMENAEEIEIEERSVLRSYIEREQGDTVWLSLEFNDVWYVILYKLNDGNTEEDVMSFAKSFIKRLNDINESSD